MRVRPDSDETEVIRAFGDQLAGLARTRPALEEPATRHREEAARLGEVAAVLADAGWLDVATGGDEDGGSFTLLCALAERAGADSRPFAFPLLETWLARRLLAVLPEAPTLADGDLPTVAVDLLCGNDMGGSFGSVPFGRCVRTVLVAVPAGDGGARVHLAEPGELSLEAGLAVDPSMPTWQLTGLDGLGDAVGVLAAEQLRRFAAEYLCLQACEIAGIAGVLLDASVRHLRSRTQFGSPLARFQALQHRAADLLVDVESVRSLGHHAAWAVETGLPDHEDYALTAKGLAGERGIGVANGAIQLHGGIGYTWEAGLHWGAKRIAYRAVTGRHSVDALHESGRRAVARGSVLAGISPVDAVRSVPSGQP